jgi:hypothetical protein
MGSKLFAAAALIMLAGTAQAQNTYPPARWNGDVISKLRPYGLQDVPNTPQPPWPNSPNWNPQFGAPTQTPLNTLPNWNNQFGTSGYPYR